MKRFIFLLLGAALLLTGCSGDSSEDKRSRIIAETMSTDKYNSNVTFQFEQTVDENSLTDAAKVLEARLGRALTGSVSGGTVNFGHSKTVNSADKTVQFYFNTDPRITESSLKIMAMCGLVELRKGDGADGQLVLNNQQVLSAAAEQTKDSASGESGWAVKLKFTEAGRTAFEKATKELAEKQGTITVWLDGKAVVSPKVKEKISDGICVITGVNSEQEARELAAKLSSGYMKNKAELKEFSLDKNASSTFPDDPSEKVEEA